MPEHDETNAPDDEPEDPRIREWELLEAQRLAVEAARRKSKLERWRVEDKVVDGESK